VSSVTEIFVLVIAVEVPAAEPVPGLAAIFMALVDRFGIPICGTLTQGGRKQRMHS
jgi:hypothetical protein